MHRQSRPYASRRLFRGALPAVLLAAATLVWPTLTAAQPVFAALFDLVLNPGLDIAGDNGQSTINTASRGEDPFHTIRGRLFMDGELGEWITVNARFLFDANDATGAPIVRLDGAFATVWTLFGIEALNLQAGNIPWAFGSYAPRTYSDRNPVIGAPLIYSYHTGVMGGDDYGSGASHAHHLTEQIGFRENTDYQMRGLIPVYDSWWGNGVTFLGAVGPFDYAVSATTAAVSNPAGEGNGMPYFLGRVGFVPTLGFSIGASAGFGPYLAPEAAGKTGTGKTAGDPTILEFEQLIFGTDVSLTLGKLALFAEGVRNHWRVPNVGVLGLWSWYVELRYDLLPRVYAAVRYDQMIFDRVQFGGSPTSWDYDVLRFEPGLGFRLTREVRLKVVGQLNFRDGPGNNTEDYLLAAQLSAAL